MKIVRAFAACACLLTLALPLHAGEWRISGHFGGGYTSYHDRGSYGVHFSNFGLRLPGYGPPPPCWSPRIRHHTGRWGAYRRGRHFPRYGGHRWYPYGRWGSTPVYYSRITVIGADPWVGATLSATGVGYGSYREYSGRSGVFVVPKSGLTVESAERPQGVGAPLFQPAADPTLAARASNPRPPANLAKAGAYLRRGNLIRAEGELKNLLRRNPSDARLSTVYAYVLFLREKYATAAYVLRRALVLEADVVAAGASTLGEFYDAERSANALTRLDRYVGEHPEDTSARFLRAYVAFLSGKTDAARDDLAVILKADGNDAEAAALLKACTPGGDETP